MIKYTNLTVFAASFIVRIFNIHLTYIYVRPSFNGATWRCSAAAGLLDESGGAGRLGAECVHKCSGVETIYSA